jgi:hypothetical protein
MPFTGLMFGLRPPSPTDQAPERRRRQRRQQLRLDRWLTLDRRVAVHVIVVFVGLSIWPLTPVIQSSPIASPDHYDEHLKFLEMATMSEDESGRSTTPRYMIDLYRKFASDRYSTPIANIIRSFTAVTEGITTLKYYFTSSSS